MQIVTSEVNLKNTSDLELLQSTEGLVLRERSLTKHLLLHFREIESRRLYAARGFASLHEMLVKKWGYSSSAAWRRVQAMRLLSSVPEAAKSLQSGEVNLSTLAKAQSLIRAEQKATNKPVTVELKKKAIEAIKNKPERESEKDLFEIFQAAASTPKDATKRTSQSNTVITLSASDETLQALKRLKEVWAAKNPQMSWSELIEIMAKDCVERHDPVLKSKRSHAKSCAKEKATDNTQSENQNLRSSAPNEPVAPKELPQSTSSSCSSRKPNNPLVAQRRTGAVSRRVRGYIPVHVRQSLYRKSNGQCEYIDPLTKRRCENKHGLEIDHIRPKALGGSDELRNLRHLCRTHNLLSARDVLGQKVMDSYWR